MATSIKIPDSVDDLCVACVPVGSRVTCNPPPTDTDQDILCLVEEDQEEALFLWLEKRGWKFDGDEKYDLSDFTSYRKGEFNLIITTTPEWFDSFMDATRECKAQNVMSKEGRIAVFEKYIPKKTGIGTKLKTILQQQALLQAHAAQFQQTLASIQGSPQNAANAQAAVVYWNGQPNHGASLWDTVIGNNQ